MIIRAKKVSYKFGVYEFLVFQQIEACNSMLYFLSIIGRLSMVKSIYLSNRKLQIWSSPFSTNLSLILNAFLNFMHTDAAMTQWIDQNFRNPNRPNCLLLIGPTETGRRNEKEKENHQIVPGQTGTVVYERIRTPYSSTWVKTIIHCYLQCNLDKTSFALSLPGRVCYFKGRWSLSIWSDEARYLVFNDIPWDI
jgi:hypothetical protein